MIWQYIIVSLVIAAAMAYGVWRILLTWRDASKRELRCAGCPLEDSCKTADNCDKQPKKKKYKKKHSEKFAGNKNI